MLPVAHEQKIRQVPGVTDVCQMQWFGAYYKEPKNFFANFAIDHATMAAIWDDYVAPERHRGLQARRRRGAIVGSEPMKRGLENRRPGISPRTIFRPT